METEKAFFWVVEKLPFPAKRWFDSTNIEWIKSLRARKGPLTVDYIQTIASNPDEDVVAYCPLCASAIKVYDTSGGKQVLAMLYHQDQTVVDPDVRIAKRQTLFVECGGEKYQVGCVGRDCRKVSPKDRVGILDATGKLVHYSITMAQHMVRHNLKITLSS